MCVVWATQYVLFFWQQPKWIKTCRDGNGEGGSRFQGAMEPLPVTPQVHLMKIIWPSNYIFPPELILVVLLKKICHCEDEEVQPNLSGQIKANPDIEIQIEKHYLLTRYIFSSICKFWTRDGGRKVLLGKCRIEKYNIKREWCVQYAVNIPCEWNSTHRVITHSAKGSLALQMVCHGGPLSNEFLSAFCAGSCSQGTASSGARNPWEGGTPNLAHLLLAERSPISFLIWEWNRCLLTPGGAREPGATGAPQWSSLN